VKRRIMLGTFALSSGYYDAYYGRAQAVRARLRADFDAGFARSIIFDADDPEPAFRHRCKDRRSVAMYLSDISPPCEPRGILPSPSLLVFAREAAAALQIMGPRFPSASLPRRQRVRARDGILARIAAGVHLTTGGQPALPTLALSMSYN